MTKGAAIGLHSVCKSNSKTPYLVSVATGVVVLGVLRSWTRAGAGEESAGSTSASRGKEIANCMLAMSNHEKQ